MRDDFSRQFSRVIRNSQPLSELAKRERFKRSREFYNFRLITQLNDVPQDSFYCFSIHWDELNQYTAQGQSRNAFTDKFRPYREENIELGAIVFLSEIQSKDTIISSGSDSG